MKSRFLEIPLRRGSSGGLSETGDIDRHIKDKMKQVLFTVPGERVNLPEFGCRLMDLVFEGNNEILVSAVSFSVTQSLRRWMGEEVEIEEVRVHNDEEALFIQVFYSRLDTRIPERLEVAYKL